MAEEYHEEHHSYMPYLERVDIVSHGGFFDGEIAGVITYAKPRREAPILGHQPRQMAEVARVTVGLKMQNLASCIMARSQDKFSSEHASRNGFTLLLTFVKEGYEGTMFKALEGKGWICTGDADIGSGYSSNREFKEIQAEAKQRWVCEIRENGTEQATLAAATGGEVS